MKGLSKLEMKVVADFEFQKKYYFTRDDIRHHFASKQQLKDTLYNLHKKKRIVRLNKNKYFLIPVKARTGGWSDHPFIIADEIMNGNDYFIGGWSAANHWRLTDQIPMQIDIWSTKKQGKIEVLHTRLIFHRTTAKMMQKAVTQHLQDHPYKILNKYDAAEWVKGRD